MKLSILIPTIIGREDCLKKLIGSLSYQTGIVNFWLAESANLINRGANDEIEIIVLTDNKEMSIGEKRNKLLSVANGEYCCFIDDDDEISEEYIKLLLEVAESGCDCASLKGVITTDGANPQIFEHSLKYIEWKTNTNTGFGDVVYERYNNHLNMIKTSIAKQFKFPDKNFSEDYDWSKLLHESGLLKTEYYIEDILYYYKFVTKK